MGIKLAEMDARVSLAAQLQNADGDDSPVVLINQFTAPPQAAEALQAAWTKDAKFMQTQPGFISAQLHRGLAGSGVFVNVAEWKSIADFRTAFSNPEFQAHLGDYPPDVVASPHLFKKVAVPGVCAE